MLYTSANEFGWTTDSWSSTITEALIGTSVAAHASAHTKGTAVSLLAGASVTEDVFGVEIMFAGGATSGAIRRFLADLLIDPAGGTSWTTLIANLFVNSPSLQMGGYRYYFPLFLKSGTSIGLQQQCSTGSTTLRACVKVFGKPSRPDLVKVGSKFETFGVDTSTTSGTACTPGNGVEGTYASLGTTANDLWWWQWGGMGVNDISISAAKCLLGDVACGDATNKRICVHRCANPWTAGEDAGKMAIGSSWPIQHIKAGETVYARMMADGTPDTTPTTTAYGMGG